METRIKGGRRNPESIKDKDGAHPISPHATVEPRCRKRMYFKTEL